MRYTVDSFVEWGCIEEYKTRLTEVNHCLQSTSETFNLFRPRFSSINSASSAWLLVEIRVNENGYLSCSPVYPHVLFDEKDTRHKSRKKKKAKRQTPTVKVNSRSRIGSHRSLFYLYLQLLQYIWSSLITITYFQTGGLARRAKQSRWHATGCNHFFSSPSFDWFRSSASSDPYFLVQ